MRLKTPGLLAALVLTFGLGGCSSYSDVQTALGIVGQVIQIAQTDLPSLQAAGTLTTADGTAVSNWLNGASLLLGQAQSCVTTVGSKGSKAAFATCITTFGTGLLSPSEMADLRIVSPNGQKQVTIWVTAVVLAANAAGAIVKALATNPPTVGTAPPATTEEMNDFKARLHLPLAYGQ